MIVLKVLRFMLSLFNAYRSKYVGLGLIKETARQWKLERGGLFRLNAWFLLLFLPIDTQVHYN